MFYPIIDNSHILIMLVARLGLFKFSRKFSYFIYMHQRMGNGAGSTDLTNFFSNDDFWSTLRMIAILSVLLTSIILCCF